MIYVITGATSFVGIELCKLLLSMNNKVYAVSRNRSVNLAFLPIHPNLNVVFSDLEHIGSLRNVISNADVFVNLAWAGTDHSGRNDVDIHLKNIQYTLDAMLLAKNMKCSLFVQAGSQAEYGCISDIITESAACAPETEYGKAKLSIWKKGCSICNDLKMKYLHLRIFSIYGENDHPWTLIMSCIRKMLSNEDVELSHCTQKWNFLYVKDAVKQIVLLCNYALSYDDFKCEIYNIASEDTRELKDYVEELYKLTDSRSRLLYGAFSPKFNVSLNPSVTKTKNVIGFISEYSFGDVINCIISNQKKGHD